MTKKVRREAIGLKDFLGVYRAVAADKGTAKDIANKLSEQFKVHVEPEYVSQRASLIRSAFGEQGYSAEKIEKAVPYLTRSGGGGRTAKNKDFLADLMASLDEAETPQEGGETAE